MAAQTVAMWVDVKVDATVENWVACSAEWTVCEMAGAMVETMAAAMEAVTVDKMVGPWVVHSAAVLAA